MDPSCLSALLWKAWKGLDEQVSEEESLSGASLLTVHIHV